MDRMYLTPYERLEERDDDVRLNMDFDGRMSDVTLMYYIPKPKFNRFCHAKNLDSFFKTLYNYHQDGCFYHKALIELSKLISFTFAVMATIVTYESFNHIVLQNRLPPGQDPTEKIKITQFVTSLVDSWKNRGPVSDICLKLSCIYLIYKIISIIKNLIRLREMKLFFNEALGIQDCDLRDTTWEDVIKRTMEAQKFRMCVNKETLTELDIYNRILRFENYFTAMVQKKVITFELNFPFLGKIYFMPRVLQLLLKRILFDHTFGGAFNRWYLKEEYKHFENREYLARKLNAKFVWIGLISLAISIFVLIAQVFHTIYCYFAFVRADPSIFTIRRWSNYAKVSLRHYNELDHELNARLSRGYNYAKQYMNSHSSSLTASIVLPVSYITGIMTVVTFVFAMLDSKIFDVEQAFICTTIFGFITYGLHKFLPDKNIYYCPKKLMNNICNEVHYLPEFWKGKAHTSYVRNEFSYYFPHTINIIIESLVSPIVTPFIFMFNMREKSLEIVDFLRNFTVEVSGVGDICSFALMDVGKHGNHTSANRSKYFPPNVTDNGKTELSLLQFCLNNPNWKPPQNSEAFLRTVKEQSRVNLVGSLFQQEHPRLCGIDNCIDNADVLHDISSLHSNLGWKSVILSAHGTTSSRYYPSNPPSVEESDDKSDAFPNLASSQKYNNEASQHDLNLDSNTVGA